MLRRGINVCLRAYNGKRTPFTSPSSPFLSSFSSPSPVPSLISSVRRYSNPNQPQQPEEPPRQLYTYEKTGPSLDFRDDFVGDVQPANKDKWAGVEATGFRKKYLHEKVAKDVESLRTHLASITERVRSKSIGTTKEDKILLRKLSAMLDVTEIELQAHQAEWRKAAKPKRKIRKFYIFYILQSF